MQKRGFGKHLRDGAVVTATILALVDAQSAMAQPASGAGPYGPSVRDGNATTPIKHVIIIIGENWSFDSIFATYPPKAGETVNNLLSEGIVNTDGTPGASYSKATQSSATDTGVYQLAPPKTPYQTLPPFHVGGGADKFGTPFGCAVLGTTLTPPATDCNSTANVAAVMPFENGLSLTPTNAGGPVYYQYLLTGGTGQTSGGNTSSTLVPDARVFYDNEDASNLPHGPFQLTQNVQTPHFPYDSYAASPVHRYFQMYQELDCSVATETTNNPSGCLSDLWPWVETTVSSGSNGKAPPAGWIGEGSTAMQFFNVQAGDAPYLKSLADAYTMSDNYHQGVLGGTGANHIMLGTGDAIWFSNGAGVPEVPPNNPVDPAMPGTPVPGHSSALSEIENPDPMVLAGTSTNNFYTQDGYGGGSGSPTATAPNANYGGGSYVNCADTTQPGVKEVDSYLAALSPSIKPNCEAGHYYLVNNYNPGYFGDGKNAYTDTNTNNFVYTIPPSNVRNIGNELSDTKISWAYFGDQFNQYLADPYQLNFAPSGTGKDNYCNICNWAQYNTAIMTDPASRNLHLHDTADLYAGISKGKLPAVSWVKPSGLVDGHPASSKLDLFEGFVKKIVDGVQANSALWNDTAIFVTFDEGGGSYDSGYVQQLDFFGDGARIPMIVVSQFSQGGHIKHTYADHASTLKFIEANWGLSPITTRSRDNLPNPSPGPNAYVPGNRPAIGDLMDMFTFP
jgi:phospholipase C